MPPTCSGSVTGRLEPGRRSIGARAFGFPLDCTGLSSLSSPRHPRGSPISLRLGRIPRGLGDVTVQRVDAIHLLLRRRQCLFAGSAVLGLDDQTRVARLLHHVTPVRVGVVVAATDGTVELQSKAVAVIEPARAAPRKAGLRVHQARPSLAATDVVTFGGHFTLAEVGERYGAALVTGRLLQVTQAVVGDAVDATHKVPKVLGTLATASHAVRIVFLIQQALFLARTRQKTTRLLTGSEVGHLDVLLFATGSFAQLTIVSIGSTVRAAYRTLLATLFGTVRRADALRLSLAQHALPAVRTANVLARIFAGLAIGNAASERHPKEETSRVQVLGCPRRGRVASEAAVFLGYAHGQRTHATTLLVRHAPAVAGFNESAVFQSDDAAQDNVSDQQTERRSSDIVRSHVQHLHRRLCQLLLTAASSSFSSPVFATHTRKAHV